MKECLFLYYGSGRQAAQLLANTNTVAEISQTDIHELREAVAHGKQAEETIIKYCDWLLTTWNLKPPTEGDMPVRPESNPCAKSFEEYRDFDDEDYADLANTVERHICQPT